MDEPQPGSKVPFNMFTYNAKYLFQKALNANKMGDYFPIWGTCLGFQLLHYLVNNLTYPMQNITNELYVTRNLIYDFGGSRLYQNIDINLRNYAAQVGVAFYHHQECITDLVYSNYPAISKFF